MGFALRTSLLISFPITSTFRRDLFVTDNEFNVTEQVKKWHGITVPEHYKLYVGFVRSTQGEEKTITDRNNKIAGVEISIKFDWDFGQWDLRLEDDGAITYEYEPIDETKALDLRLLDDKELKYLGRIQDGASRRFIKDKAEALAAEMNKKGYNKLFNNCRDFAHNLYDKIKYQGKRGLPELESYPYETSCSDIS